MPKKYFVAHVKLLIQAEDYPECIQHLTSVIDESEAVVDWGFPKVGSNGSATRRFPVETLAVTPEFLRLSRAIKEDGDAPDDLPAQAEKDLEDRRLEYEQAFDSL